MHRTRSLIAGTLLAAIARIALAHGDLHEQIDTLTRRIDASPHDVRLVLRRADLHARHGDWPAALVDFDRAASIAPAMREIDRGRAAALLQSGRAEQAKVLLDGLIEQGDRAAESFLLRARANEARADWTAVARDYDEVIARLTPPQPDHYVARARAQALAGTPDQAIRGLDEGIARLGPLVSLHAKALELERAQQAWNAALRRTNAMYATNSRKESLHLLRAEILRDAGRRDQARQEQRLAEQSLAALPPHLRGSRAVRELALRIQQLGSELGGG
jgi:tetratricopeptide (TPR) repeat protein